MGSSKPEIVGGRYAIYDEIASGGMASVHYGRVLGAANYSRPVAVKRLHAHLAREPEFATMFLDEARVAVRIRHPNVVSTFDAVTTDDELFLVMEYIHGESFSRLLADMRRRGGRLPVAVTVAIVVGMLHGLHAAHEATDSHGALLHTVHRDVSPQNVIVGGDGVARVVDFGVAKAVGRLQTTRTGQIKGKFAYMAPEQVRGHTVTRAADIYSAGVVVWEALAGERLFTADHEGQLAAQIVFGKLTPPGTAARAAGRPGDDASDVSPELDAIVMCALEREPGQRFATARDFALALEAAVPVATTAEVAQWVQAIAGPTLQVRAARLAEIERGLAGRSATTVAPPRPAGGPGDTRDRSSRRVAFTRDSTRPDRAYRPEGAPVGASDPSGMASVNDAGARSIFRVPRPLGFGLASAALVIAIGATLIPRVGDVHGWFGHSTGAAGGSQSALAARALPPAAAAITSAPAAPAARAGSTTPFVPATTGDSASAWRATPATPTTISIEALPRVPLAAPPASAAPHPVRAARPSVR